MLDSHNVTQETHQYDMRVGGYRIETIYTFGDYKLNHTEYNPKPKTTPLGQFKLVDSTGKFIGHWNESFREDNKYIYELYIAVKNKYDGKPYINPYKVDNIDMLKNILQTNAKYIFPDNMPTEKCADAILELQQVLQRHILPYKMK